MAAQRPAVFIGSSSEGKTYAEHLQAALDDHCEAVVWDQGVFGLSESSLDALVAEARRVDFAILVLTPDDLTHVRGRDAHCARDNVIFEAGMFVGALGPTRTFFVHPNDLQLDLPTDLAGITTCTFRSQRQDENVRAAVNTAALRIREAMLPLGVRTAGDSPSARARPRETVTPGRPVADERTRLARELDTLTANAESQGWSLRTRTESVYRLLSPEAVHHSLELGAPRGTRANLRRFARKLAEHGLRVDPDLVLPLEDVPAPD